VTAYAEAVERRNDLRQQREALVEQHRIALRNLDRHIESQQHVIDVAEAGGPAEAFLVAREVLSIGWARGRDWVGGHLQEVGPRRQTSEVRRQFDAAIEDLQAGCPVMRREYFGVKSYDQWPSQESNHTYGFGPKHGSIWFSIGLRNPTADLSDEQRIACVQWLRAIRDNPELLP